MLLILIILLPLIPTRYSYYCDCGLSYSYIRELIYKGSKASRYEFPWMAYIRFFDYIGSTRYSLCGGSLIDEYHIITAAHCIFDSKENIRRIDAVEVYLGVNNLYQLNTPYRVIKFFHPNGYKQSTLYNDIAIIRLDRKVNFTRRIYPICLPIIDADYHILQVTGFGRLGPDKQPAHYLMHVYVDYIHKKKCNAMVHDFILRKYPEIKANINKYELPRVHSTHICAVDLTTGGDACRGDSGGPLMYASKSMRIFAVGIISGALDECGDPRTPGFYTQITKYFHFINTIAPNARYCDILE